MTMVIWSCHKGRDTEKSSLQWPCGELPGVDRVPEGEMPRQAAGLRGRVPDQDPVIAAGGLNEV